MLPIGLWLLFALVSQVSVTILLVLLLLQGRLAARHWAIDEGAYPEAERSER